MFGPPAFAIRKGLSLLDELHREREGNFVQLNTLLRLSCNGADRKKRNCDYDRMNKGCASDDCFHSRKSKRLPRAQKWQQYSPRRAVVQLGRTLEWGSRGRGFESRRPDVFSLGEPSSPRFLAYFGALMVPVSRSFCHSA